jgi:hypothetical protein
MTEFPPRHPLSGPTIWAPNVWIYPLVGIYRYAIPLFPRSDRVSCLYDHHGYSAEDGIAPARGAPC